MLGLMLVLALLALAALAGRAAIGPMRSELFQQQLRGRLCRVFGHRHGGVWKIDTSYHSRCRRCGARLRKQAHGSAWQDYAAH